MAKATVHFLIMLVMISRLPVTILAVMLSVTHVLELGCRNWQSLHWLRVLECIQYKLALVAYKVLHEGAPSYLGPLIHITDLPGR